MDIIVSNMDSTPIYEQITSDQGENPRLEAAARRGAAVYASAGEGCASALSRPSVRMRELAGAGYHQPDRTQQLYLHRSAANVAGSAASHGGRPP